MKLLFIWPNKDSFGFKPISLSLLSAILKKKGHAVQAFDTTFIDFGFEGISETRSKIRIFKPVDFSGYDIRKKKVDFKKALTEKLNDFKPDLVGVSALSDEVPIGLMASKYVKEWKSDVPVIWGNKAATMDPQVFLEDEHIDYVCRGEGIEFIIDFVDRIEKGADLFALKNLAFRKSDGRAQTNPLRPFFQELDSLPYYDWSIFDSRQFLKPFDGKVTIGGDHMIQWGCPNLCSYCINHAYMELYKGVGGKYIRRYSIDRIIDELKYLVKKWELNFFKYHDEDFCLKPLSYFEALAESYREHVNVPFTCMANAKSVTGEKVSLLKKMNCVSVSIGIETGNETLRKQVLRRRETKEEIIRAIRLLNEAGIRTSAFNMLGIPGETRDTIMETIQLNRESEVRYPNTVFFYPLVGTDLWKKAIDEYNFGSEKQAVFDDKEPSLRFENITKDELIALRERFNLYVKMPEKFHKYIQRSEKNDDIGKRLTEQLFIIYEEIVFQNDGVWKSKEEDDVILEQLEKISRKNQDDLTPYINPGLG